jgi:methylmalonyl-CoA mutase cobalamin-binding domain/chain
LIGTLGLDQHEVGAMAVAQLLTRHGFEVIYLGRFNTPAKLAAVAQEEDADVVGKLDELVARARAGLTASAESRARPQRPLDGRVVIVSGAGRGLGRAYAERLAREGAAVVLNDLDPDVLADWSGEGVTVPGDISVPETSQQLVRAALDRYSRLDGVVCNAGLLRSSTLMKLSAEDLDAVYAVHVRGTFLLLRAAATHWRAEAKAARPVAAAAVTTTSSAGLYGFLGEIAYSGAKAAIAAMTLVAAAELERYGVTVNAIAPAARTRLTAWMGEPPGDEQADPYAAAHVAPVVAWLLSDSARDITGRVLEVGGDAIAVADGWRPVVRAELPRGASVQAAGALIERLLREAPEPREVQRADPALLQP